MASGPGNKPVTSASFFVLLGLAGGVKHGLGISDEVAALTQGDTVLGPGSLYTALKRLLGEGLVEEAPRPLGEIEDPRRNYYRLTTSGRAALVAETRRLGQVVDATQRLGVLDHGGGG